MAEYIKISDYCKLSVLSKSKVYRAINSGAIVTKKIDGVQYVDLDSLSEEYKLPSKATTSKKLIPQNTLIELSKNSAPEIIAVDNKLSNRSDFNNPASIDLVKTFYDNLEQRTQYTISMQEETINYYKSELNKRNDQIEFLMELLKQKETKHNGITISSESTKDLTIANQEKMIIELNAKLNEVNNENAAGVIEKDTKEVFLEPNLNAKLSELSLQIETLKKIGSSKDQNIITELKENDEYLCAIEKTISDLKTRMSEVIFASDETYQEISSLKTKFNESLQIISEYQNREKEYINILTNESNKINYIGTEVFDRESYVDSLSFSRGELTKRIEEIQEASAFTNKEVQEIKSKLDKSYENITEAKYNELEMESIVQDEISQIENIKTELGDRETYYDNLSFNKEELDERLQEINEAINETTNKLSQLSDKLQQSSYIENNIELANIKNEFADREEYLLTLNKAKLELEERLHDIHSEYQDNTQELKELRYKLKENLNKIVSFEQKEQEYEEIIRKEAEEITQLKQEISDRDLYMKDLESSKKELEERLEEISNGSNKTSNELGKLKEELEESIERIEEYKNKEKAASCVLEDESKKVFELEKELNDRDSYLEALKNSKNDLQIQIDDLLIESTKRKNIITSLEDKLNESSEQLEILRKTNQSLEVKIQETEELIKGYENDKLLEGDDEQIEALEEELFDKEHQISELELELCIKEDNINFYKKEVDQLKQKISSLEQFVNDQRNPLNDLETPVNNDLYHFQLQLEEKDNQIKVLNLEKEHSAFLINNLENDLEFYKKLDLSGENISVDTHQRLSWLLNEAEERQKIIIKLDMIIRERNNIIKDKDSILKERQDRILDLEKFLAKRQNLQDALEKEIEDLKETNLKFSGKINPTVQSNLEDEIMRLKSIIDDKDIVIEQLQKNIQNLENINSGLNNKLNLPVEDSKNSTKELNSNLNELFDQLSQKEQQITELIHEINDKDEIIVSLQAGPEKQLISFDEDSEYEDQDLISSLEEQINNLLEENADKDQQIEHLQALLNNNGAIESTEEESLKAPATATTNLEEELQELKTLLAQKEEELKTERQKFINCAISKSPQSIQLMNVQPKTKESLAGNGVTDNLPSTDETILNEETMDKTDEL